MPSSVTVRFADVRKLLRSQEVLADLERRAKRVAAAAGKGHVVDSDVGRNRARASVRTVGFEAARREATRHTLTAAVQAAK